MTLTLYDTPVAALHKELFQAHPIFFYNDRTCMHIVCFLKTGQYLS